MARTEEREQRNGATPIRHIVIGYDKHGKPLTLPVRTSTPLGHCPGCGKRLDNNDHYCG